jgi:hypothetical protein
MALNKGRPMAPPRPRGQRTQRSPSCSHINVWRRSLRTLPAGTRAHHFPVLEMKVGLNSMPLPFQGLNLDNPNSPAKCPTTEHFHDD